MRNARWLVQNVRHVVSGGNEVCVSVCGEGGWGVLYKAGNAILTHVDLTLKGFLQQIV